MGRDRRGAEFDDFVRSRTPALLRVAYLLTGDRHAAEDVLQDVLAATYVRWPHIQGAPEPYVRRALVNQTSNRWRMRRRKPERPLRDAEEPEPSRDHGEELVVRDVVVSALRTLPSRQRAAVVLRYLEDLPVAEVATILGCSEGAVKSHTARGLQHLRKAMDASAERAR